LLLGLHLIEERVQCFEAGLPVPAELLGPQRHFLERRCAQAAEVLPPDDAAADEFGPLQHAHVLGGGGEGHSKGRGEFAEVAFPDGELPDDRAAGGVGQGVKDDIQSGRSIYYHMVYYTNWLYDLNHEDPAPVPVTRDERQCSASPAGTLGLPKPPWRSASGELRTPKP
jgi:hypothetical protein